MKKQSIVITAALLGLALTAPAPAEEKEKGVTFRADVFKRGEHGYHTYRIPAMVVTASGTVLLFAEGRKTSRQDGGDVDMLMKRSEDGGRTWSRNILIHEEGGNAKIRVGNPCAIVERDGKTVHLLFTRGGGECLFYTRSTDDGKTWSKFVKTSDVEDQPEYKPDNFLKGFGESPVSIGAGPVHGIHTSKGRLIAPSYGGYGKDGKRLGGSLIIYSDDGGDTWKAGGTIPPGDDFHHGECTIVELSDGSLMMNMRTGAPGKYSRGYRAVSISKDGGMTWSDPVLDKNLPEPACQGSILRLNEKEILFMNPAVHHEGGWKLTARHNLTLRLSQDDGTTWKWSRILRQGLAGYSDLAVTKDGKILCAYENGERDYCEKISIVELDRSWLTDGEKAKTKSN